MAEKTRIGIGGEKTQLWELTTMENWHGRQRWHGFVQPGIYIEFHKRDLVILYVTVWMVMVLRTSVWFIKLCYKVHSIGCMCGDTWYYYYGALIYTRVSFENFTHLEFYPDYECSISGSGNSSLELPNDNYFQSREGDGPYARAT